MTSILPQNESSLSITENGHLHNLFHQYICLMFLIYYYCIHPFAAVDGYTVLPNVDLMLKLHKYDP